LLTQLRFLHDQDDSSVDDGIAQSPQRLVTETSDTRYHPKDIGDLLRATQTFAKSLLVQAPGWLHNLTSRNNLLPT
jgi:hypothetical protein